MISPVSRWKKGFQCTNAPKERLNDPHYIVNQFIQHPSGEKTFRFIHAPRRSPKALLLRPPQKRNRPPSERPEKNKKTRKNINQMKDFQQYAGIECEESVEFAVPLR
jgi:hypothetical protein